MNNRFKDEGLEYLVAQLYSVDDYTSAYHSGGDITPTPAFKINWGDILGNISNQKDLMNYLSELEKEIEEAIHTIANVYKFKGSVPTYDDLPANAETGDVYNVEDTGANYAWTGSEWDKLSDIIDLEDYVKKETLALYYLKEEVDALIDGINAYSKEEIDNMLSGKADISAIYDKTAMDSKLAEKANANEVYTKAESDNKFLVADDISGKAEQTDLEALETKVDNHIAEAVVQDDLNNYYTKTENDTLLNAKANADNVYTKAESNALLDNKVDASEVYDKTELENLLEDKADKTALENYYTKEQIDEKTSTLFNYKGQVQTVAELPNNANIGDTYNVVETGANYTWNGNEWDKLSETIDLTPYVKKEDIFKNGVFTTENKKANGTVAKIWNEADGGGTQIIDGVSGVKAYTGVNEGSDGTNIYVQTYAVDKDTNIGTRINVNKEGAYLTTGKNTYTFSETDAIVTKGQMDSADAELQTAIDKVAEDLQKHIDEAETGFVTNAEFDEEVTARQASETVLQTNIDKVASDLAEHIADADQNAATKAELAQAVSDLENADTILQTNIDKVAEDLQKHIDDADHNVATKAELAEEVSAREIADNALDERLDVLEGKDFVEYVDISTPENPNRKAILLDNHNGIFGKDSIGATRLISMVSKFDVVDLGAKTLHTNLNTKQIVTVNDEQAVLTDKNLNQVVLAGDNVTIDETIVTDPTTNFTFKTYTLNAELGDVQTALTEETNARVDGDTALDNKIDGVITDVTALSETVDNHISHAEATYATKTELTAEETARKAEDNKKVDKEITSANGKALIFNEIDGGGAKFEGATRNAFAGVNDMTDPNHVGVQLYNIDKETKVGPRINLTADRATYSINKTEVGEEYELLIKKDLDSYYNKEEVDELIHDMEVGQLRQDLNDEIQNRQDADNALSDRIDILEQHTQSIFHYKGNVQTVEDLPATAEIGDVYNVIADGANYCFDGENWDKLSETVDLSAYDLTANREAADAKIISKIWNQADLDKGYFQTKATTEKGTAMIWNESDGGGTKYEGKDGLWAFTGVNEGTGNKVSDTDGTALDGRANEVMGQIYVYDSTDSISEKGNKGSWIDLTLDGFYYKKGANSNVTLDDEIATVGKVNLVQTNVDTIQTNMETLQETVDTTLAHQDGNIQSLLLQMATLEQKIQDLKSLDYEVITIYEGGDTDFDNEEKSFQLSGVVDTRLIVTGKDVTLNEATIESAYLNLGAIEDITIKNSTLTGIIPKTVTNAAIQIHADGYVSVRDCVFTPESCYNGIEVGLTNGLAKSVIIDNCTFDGTFSNNGISIFGMDDGGVVTISNCYFKDLSNILRISNRTNTHWTINLINCTCDKWEKGQYAGAILLQDYTSGSGSQADINNQFAKLTINIQNLTKPDGTKLQPVDLATICGTQDDNQIIYMYDSWRGHTAYGDKYPTITIQ